MADDTSTVTTDETADETVTDSASSDTSTQKTDVPPEMKRALNKANKEAETLRLKLKEYEDRDKTDQQKLEERATAAERAAADAATQLARYQVAVEKGLPAELAARLQGSTPEELAKDADNLLQIFGSATTATSFDGGVRPSTGKPTDMNDLIRASLSGNR